MQLKDVDPLEMIDFDQWQHMVDLLCNLAQVKSAAITRVDRDEIEAFKVSQNPGNPFHEGLRVELAHHYCEAVIEHRDRLEVSNALESDRWQQAPEIEHHLISYMGYPLMLPNGDVFGTICVHDDKKHVYSNEIILLMYHFKQLVESHFTMARQASELKRALASVKQLEGLLPMCAKCKKIRDDNGYWSAVESYVQEHSEAEFSHSICPECAELLYPGLGLYDNGG